MYEPTPECPKVAETGLTVPDPESLSMPLLASRRLRRLVATTLLAFAALPTITLWPHLFGQPGWLLLLLCFWALVGLGWWELHSWVRAYPSRLSLRGGEIWLEFPSEGVNSSCPAERVGESLVWSWLLVVPLKFRATGEQYILVCLPDSAEREALRRLRVALATNLC